jgi:hypothetical protein
MKKIVPILLAVTAGVAAASAGTRLDQRDSLLSVLPAADVIRAWSRTDSARIYGGKELYLFIDGGADLFFEYGFRQVVAAEYHKGGNESVNLEIYEMNDAGGAFGIYSVRSGGEADPVDIGQGGSEHPCYVMFWKGRFYVSVAASDSTAECRSGMAAIARAVDRNLSERGRKPHIVELLPRDNLLKERYVRGLLGMSTVRVFEVKGIFPVHDGAVGTYEDHTMTFLRYGSVMDAERHLADIITNIKTDERFKGYQHREQITTVADRRNQTVCCSRSGSYVIISISPEKAVAESSCKKGVSLLRDR